MQSQELTLFTLALAALGIAWSVAAQPYPARPIRLVVSQSTGGNADFVARAYSQRLAERFGQQIVVDNRPGGAGITVPWGSDPIKNT